MSPEPITSAERPLSRASVDRRKCSGYGICADLCPAVFKLDEEGFAYVDRAVPPEHLDAAREAEYECPEEAITVESSPP